MNNKIAFQYVGNYYTPLKYILKKITKTEVFSPKVSQKKNPISLQTSTPHVLNSSLNDYIVALKQGANIIIQLNNSFFSDLQSEILEYLGYNFHFVNIMNNNRLSLIKLYKFAKEINSKINFINFSYYFFQGIVMIILIDKVECYLRLTRASTINQDYSKQLYNKMLQAYSSDQLSIIKIIKIYHKYYKKCQAITLKENNKVIKLLIIGEPYVIINDFKDIEDKLLSSNIIIYKYTDLTHQLFKKKFVNLKTAFKSKEYIKNSSEYTINTVYQVISSIQKGIDGIIHIMSTNNNKEINNIPVLKDISKDYNVPILYLTHGKNNLEKNIEKFLQQIKK